MSSSKSNKSNDSSRSNLLTLSQDSSSSEMRSHQANIYYQKFISKLGFLFRIDTKDLDALYNKIVECVDSSEGFAQSNDADILQLIELAKKLRHNHNLLKNMVEVLDQRFLQKSIKSNRQIEANHLQLNRQIGTPNYDKLNTNNNDRNMTQIKKQNNQKKSQMHSSKIEQSIKSQNGENRMSQLMVNTSKNRSKYEERVGRMFEQMNKIKGELNKIENQNQKNEVSKKSSLSSNNGSNISNLQHQNEDHEVFMKLEENDYYLTDDRYLKSFENIQNTKNYNLKQGQKAQQNIPKLSLKDLYSKMGINPNEMDNMALNNQNERNLLNGMIQIKQTSRQSEDFFEIPSPSPSIRQQNKKYFFDPSSYLLKAQQKNLKTQLSEEEITKQKEIENSNSVGNLTNATLQSQSQQIDRKQNENKQLKNIYLEEQNPIADYNGQEGSSEKSQTISNVTIIDKLTTPFQLHSKIEADKNSSKINDQEELSERDSKFKLKDQFKKKTSFYTQILEKNEKSREKINSYLSRLDERNKVLNSYVKQMEKSLGKQKSQKEQISTQSQHNSRPLSNQIYVQNELVVPKYIPKRTSERTSIFEKSQNQSQFSIKQNKNQKVQTQQTSFRTSQVNKNEKQSKSRFSNSPIQFQQNQRSYSQLQVQKNNSQKSFKKSEQHQVPYLATLVQNNQKSRKQQSVQDTKQKKKQEIKKLNKQDHEISLELTSKNSIEDRMESPQIQSSIEQNNHLGISNQFVIPRMTTHSLFEQTRNVQSKIELSDERGYKMKVPGEQIEKIKNRVNQMFKKMKYIRNDPRNTLKHLEIPQQQLSQNNEKKEQNLKLQPPKLQSKKFEIKVPQNKIKIEPIIRHEIKIQQMPSHSKRVLQNNVYQSTNNFNSIIHKIDSPKPQIHQQGINKHLYNNPPSVKNSLVVINPPRGNTPVRLSFMYESSNNTNRDSENIAANQKISNIVSNSRESSFSFQNKLNKYDQDSIRSSLNTFPHKIIARDSVSSSRERKQFVHQSPNQPRSPEINRMIINRPPSTRSSSNQLKPNIINPAQQIKIVKNAPPLPPRVQSPKHFALPIFEISQRKIQNPPPSLSKRIHNATSNPILLQKPRINIVKEQYVKNNSSKCIDFLCPQQNKGLNRYYSSATLNNSYVSKYNSSTSIPYNNPVLTMTTPHSQTRIQSFSNTSQRKINRTDEKMQNSRHESKSSSRSHKSRKGIGVSLREQKL